MGCSDKKQPLGWSLLYDTNAANNKRMHHREAACLGMIETNFRSCNPGPHGRSPYEQNNVFSMKYLATGTNVTYPGSAGGCILKIEKCTREQTLKGAFLDFHNGAAYTEASCFMRAKEFHHHCQLTDQDPGVVATFAKTGASFSTKGGWNYRADEELLEEDTLRSLSIHPLPHMRPVSGSEILAS